MLYSLAIPPPGVYISLSMLDTNKEGLGGSTTGTGVDGATGVSTTSGTTSGFLYTLGNAVGFL